MTEDGARGGEWNLRWEVSEAVDREEVAVVGKEPRSDPALRASMVAEFVENFERHREFAVESYTLCPLGPRRGGGQQDTVLRDRPARRVVLHQPHGATRSRLSRPLNRHGHDDEHGRT
jgi:hypothetical protein